MSVLSVLGGALVGAAGALVVVALRWKDWRNREPSKVKEEAEEVESEVLFFPDPDLDPDLSEEERGVKYKCVLSGSRPLQRMCHLLSTARSSVDVCVYMLTSRQLAEAVLKGVRDRGVRVRLVVDDSQMEMAGSQVSTGYFALTQKSGKFG